MAKLTYGDLFKRYRNELYHSKLYWLGAILIVLGALLIFLSIDPLTSGVGSCILGIVLVIIAKIKVWNKEIK